MTSVFLREGRGRFETWRNIEEGHVKVEVEIRAMWPQAKECQEPMETGRGKGRVFSLQSRASGHCNLQNWFLLQP